MISAALTDEQFLEDIAAANRGDDQFRLWWLGQSGFLVQFAGQHLLLDPYLSDALTTKYAGTRQPHIRLTERVVDPARLDFIDGVTSSHRHTDHLDAETLVPLMRANPEVEILVPRAQLEFSAARLQIDEQRLLTIDAGESIDIKGFRINAITAAHETVDRDESGHCLFLGFVVQFGAWTLYHSGDTIPHAELLPQLERFAIDVALLPINGRAPQRHVSGNFWGREAAELAHRIGSQLVIPCHYGMFSFNSVTPDEFVLACHQLNQPYAVLRSGERWESLRLERRT